MASLYSISFARARAGPLRRPPGRFGFSLKERVKTLFLDFPLRGIYLTLFNIFILREGVKSIFFFNSKTYL